MARTWKHDQDRCAGVVSQAERARRLGISRQALQQREKYDAARAAGLCGRCKLVAAEPDRVLCSDCSELDRKQALARYYARKARAVASAVAS